MANVLEKNNDHIFPPDHQDAPSFNNPSSLYRSTGYINQLDFNNCSQNCPKHQNLHTTKQPDYFLPYMRHTAVLKKELESIIQEIQFITDKYREEVRFVYGIYLLIFDIMVIISR